MPVAGLTLELSQLLRGWFRLHRLRIAEQRCQLAKRQYTWFAHQPPADWLRFRETTETVAAKLVEALAFLQSGG